MTEHLEKLEQELAAINEASILEKASAVTRALSRLLAILIDFEKRIAATEKSLDEKAT